jgi:hypothetical protein
MKIRILYVCLAHLLIVSALLFDASAAADEETNHLSLAISGGASLGAYEAGLIWGLIEVLRQMDNTGNNFQGGAPLPIEISSIAGTSAGGINTILAALAWSVNPEDQGGFANRIDDNIFRDIWLTPDVNRLMPTRADSTLYLPDDALLSRHDLVAVARQLREKWRRPGTFRPGLQFPFGLTVTRVKPETMIISGISVENQRFYIPFEMHTGADGSATFFFDPNDFPTMTDPSMITMPWPADASPYTISDQQVEDALLTTSAFPVGFGRKRLQYCRKRFKSTEDESIDEVSMATTDPQANSMKCPEGFKLAESEFADGGLFDNLPIGLARTLSESSRLHRQNPLPVKYIYLDPNRVRYESHSKVQKQACKGENPPEACRELTYDLASEITILGGAVGTARRYELYKELTGENWRLNLSQLTRETADMIDANRDGMRCDSLLPYFDRQLNCSDRLRYAARLLEFTHSHRITPIITPLSAQQLLQEKIATTCLPPSKTADPSIVSTCTIDAPRFRKQLAGALAKLSVEISPEENELTTDIQRSALSIDSDRLIHLTSRGNPVTGLLLDSFGAFFDYKFREFDYYAGVYDAIVVIADNQCTRDYPSSSQHTQRSDCRDRLSEQLYNLLGVPDNPKSRYAFALMARQEFSEEGAMRFAYAPMPPEDRDLRIIFEGLNQSFLAGDGDEAEIDAGESAESTFFKHLRAEGFEPTPPPEGGKSLLHLIMDDPDYWSNELVKRATNRLIYLAQQAEDIYQAREPDPEKRETAHTALTGAGSLALRTVTYKYPKFTFSPSTAPESWIWRNIIPYEAAFDLVDGDTLLFWQPTWNFGQINAGVRFGLGFTGGIFDSDADNQGGNFGLLGVDLTRNEKTGLFSGWGVTPFIHHNWQQPADADQTSLGLDVHVNFFKNRIRVGLGAWDIVNNAGDNLFLMVGIADLPGLIYWMSR